MGPQVLSKLSNTMQCSEVFPVSVQSGDNVRLVLIFITTDYHQTIVCGGRRGEEMNERGRVRRSGEVKGREREGILLKVSRRGEEKEEKVYSHVDQFGKDHYHPLTLLLPLGDFCQGS